MELQQNSFFLNLIQIKDNWTKRIPVGNSDASGFVFRSWIQVKSIGFHNDETTSTFFERSRNKTLN